MLKVFNTLGNPIQEFNPVHSGKVRMYVCGVTVYDTVHVGHARSYVNFDMIRRYLEYAGYSVEFVQNFTDIDDKIINRANDENRDWRELTSFYIGEYFRLMDKLGIKRASHYPKASEAVEAMIAMTAGLVEKGHAYVASNGDVYFSVASFAGYGALVSTARLQQEVVSRIGDSDLKRDPQDFALWKAAKPGEPSWDSPWGPGRPGWHIECSAMSLERFGGTFDIHGGGLDLIFPHHTNEIAQTEALTGKRMANYWLHNGFIKVGSEKMSKSLGNFITLEEAITRHGAAALRMAFVRAHYRSQFSLDIDVIDDAKAALDRLAEALGDADTLLAAMQNRSEELNKAGQKLRVRIDNARSAFRAAMDDDFNSSGAVAVLFELAQDMFAYFRSVAPSNAKGANTALIAESRELLLELLAVLGFRAQRMQLDVTAMRNALAHEGIAVETCTDPLALAVELRNLHRSQKDFAAADRVRDAVKAATGLNMKDWPFGSSVSAIEIVTDTGQA